MSIEKMMNMEKNTQVIEMENNDEHKTYTSMYEWNKYRMPLVKSQKARALDDYVNFGKSYSGYRVPKTLYVLVDDDPWEVVKWCESTISVDTDIFVRTCPLNPRHGVLESTRCVNHKNAIVKTIQHLQAVMLEHDPEGCLIVQPYQPAVASCVLAPNMYVVFGEGHDGVTAGTNYSDAGTSLMFPLSEKEHLFEYALKRMSQETENEVDYDINKHEIEMVFNDGESNRQWDDDYINSVKAILTQIRGCDEHIQVGTPPEGVSINGSIPDGDVVVTETVVMTGLEQVQWLEENITKELCPDGFVVVEPNGSLLSHINAHCRTHGIPYVITDEVCVGDTWTEVASGWVIQNNDGDFVANPYNPWQHISAFRDGVTYGNAHWNRKQSALSTFFHQWMGQPCNDPELSAFLGGVFCAWIVKATIAATVGEMRHARSQKKNYRVTIPLAINSFMGVEPMSDWDMDSGIGIPQNRRPYHRWMRDVIVDWEQASYLLTYMHDEYKTGWSSAYGGPKWGDGASKGARVARLIHQLMQASADELEEVGKELVEAVNALENAQHNNGGLLNKFGSDTMIHFTAGTLGYEEGQMRHALHSYMIAMDIVNDRVETNAQECNTLWEDVVGFFSKSPSYFRSNHVFKHTDAPEDVQTVIDKWNESSVLTHMFHGDSSHQYNKTGHESYIPTGHSCDGQDTNHFNKLSVQNNTSVPTNTYDVFLLGKQQTQVVKVESDVVKKAKKAVANTDWELPVLIADMCHHVEAGTWEEVEHVYAKLVYELHTNEFVTYMNALKLAQEMKQ